MLRNIRDPVAEQHIKMNRWLQCSNYRRSKRFCCLRHLKTKRLNFEKQGRTTKAYHPPSTSIRNLLSSSMSPSSPFSIHHPSVNVRRSNTPLFFSSVSLHHSDPFGITSSFSIFDPANKLHVAAMIYGLLGSDRPTLGTSTITIIAQRVMVARSACKILVEMTLC